MCLKQFRDSLGLIGSIELFLPERMFYAFDIDCDGKLSFLDYATSLFTMLRGSESAKLELSYKIINTKCKLHGITLDEFVELVRSIFEAKASLLRETPQTPSYEQIYEIFYQVSSVNSYGDREISKKDYIVAIRTNYKFAALLGVSNQHPLQSYCSVCARTITDNSQTPFYSTQNRHYYNHVNVGHSEFRRTYYGKRIIKQIRSKPIRDFASEVSLPIQKPGNSNEVVNPKCLAVYFGHKRWNHVINTMIGLRLTAKQVYKHERRQIFPADFNEYYTFIINPNDWLQKGPVEEMTEHSVRFTEYAPRVFREVREMAGLTQQEYCESVGPEQLIGNMAMGNLSTMSELVSEGKSGALFYYSPNGRLIIKTINKRCAQYFRKWLVFYYSHYAKNPNMLITKFYGVFSLLSPTTRGKREKLYFIVMNNVFHSNVTIHRRYDLKGSIVGRSLPEDEREDHTIALKDLDILYYNDKIRIGVDRKKKLLAALRIDVNFLRESKFLDYSLLVGFHYRNKSKDHVHWEIDQMSLETWNSIKSEDRSEMYYLGIIDIFTKWGFRKSMEHLMRSIQTFKPGKISCIHPRKYADRFQQFVSSIVI